jgi:hypothetical protein
LRKGNLEKKVKKIKKIPKSNYGRIFGKIGKLNQNRI